MSHAQIGPLGAEKQPINVVCGWWLVVGSMRSNAETTLLS